MSFTVRVILISLVVWLVVNLVGGLFTALDVSNGDFFGGFWITGMFTGLVGVFGLFITGFVILLGKINGKRPMDNNSADLLDGKPQPLSYQERALAFFAAAGVVLLVGTSICFSMLSL